MLWVQPLKKKKKDKRQKKIKIFCVPINNYFKCQWAKYINQKTLGGGLDKKKKTRHIYMMLTIDSLQN